MRWNGRAAWPPATRWRRQVPSRVQRVLGGAKITIVADKDLAGRNTQRGRRPPGRHTNQRLRGRGRCRQGRGRSLAAGRTLEELVTVDGGLGGPEEDGPKPLPWMTAAELANLVIPEPQYVCRPLPRTFLIAQLVGKTKGGKTEFVRRLVSRCSTGASFSASLLFTRPSRISRRSRPRRSARR